jgi:hypothetical protein
MALQFRPPQHGNGRLKSQESCVQGFSARRPLHRTRGSQSAAHRVRSPTPADFGARKIKGPRGKAINMPTHVQCI